MIYARIENGAIAKYPYHMFDLKKDNPSTSFPVDSLSRTDIHSNYGIVQVAEVERPSKPGWVTVEQTPALIGSTWSQAWELVPKEPYEVEDHEAEAVEPPVQEGYSAEHGTPELIDGEWKQTWHLAKNTWLENRMLAYGDPREQLEFLAENGVDSFIARVAEIKSKYPKV